MNLTPIKPGGHGAIYGHTEASLAFSESAWPFLASDFDVGTSWLASGGFHIDQNF